ncbi:hypothetical protein AAFF_G00232130 [Aldrovandia affinis]|uniref:Uncharacterized protein n=1 Tax=Aldrovandia affinis TaxID=143900 RepID=A0AAD7REU4_9TELE|nr:hypothetical protein AAFF_G00232130 [Aldrovandia affinis]
MLAVQTGLSTHSLRFLRCSELTGSWPVSHTPKTRWTGVEIPLFSSLMTQGCPHADSRFTSRGRRRTKLRTLHSDSNLPRRDIEHTHDSTVSQPLRVPRLLTFEPVPVNDAPLNGRERCRAQNRTTPKT